MRLDWNGEGVEKDVIAAAKLGIDRTAAACVEHAKNNHEWENRTGTAEGSIQIRPARVVGSLIMGQFGSYGVIYFFWLELGTIKMAAMPCLRPALDAEGPKLVQNIQDAYAEQ